MDKIRTLILRTRIEQARSHEDTGNNENTPDAVSKPSRTSFYKYSSTNFIVSATLTNAFALAKTPPLFVHSRNGTRPTQRKKNRTQKRILHEKAGPFVCRGRVRSTRGGGRRVPAPRETKHGLLVSGPQKQPTARSAITTPYPRERHSNRGNGQKKVYPQGRAVSIPNQNQRGRKRPTRLVASDGTTSLLSN